MKTYILKPTMTPATLNRTPTADKPAVGRPVPPRQPLPTAVIDPAKPRLTLGLDVHLETIMAVAQQDHSNPKAPRQFTREDLSPIRIPSEAEQRQREGTRRRKFLGRLIRMLGNRGHGQGGEYAHVKLPGRWIVRFHRRPGGPP